MPKRLNATIVMPVYNGASTLSEVFKLLETQKNKDLVKKLIVINDNSSDESLSIIEKYSQRSSYNCVIINSKSNNGLAKNYNIGIERARTSLVITMHQDILLTDKNSFFKIMDPFKDEKVGASYPTLLHPREVWETYNFWQKAMFSRFVGKRIPLLTGKFDCYSMDALRIVGNFDNKTFRTSGEDGDLKHRLQAAQLKMIPARVEVVHVHNREKKFSVKQYVKKEAQIAEGQGVKLRKYGPGSLKNFLMVFFRQIILIGLLIPYINIIFLFILIIFMFSYTRLVYFTKDSFFNKLILPFVNFSLLPISTFYSLRGFLSKKQVL